MRAKEARVTGRRRLKGEKARSAFGRFRVPRSAVFRFGYESSVVFPAPLAVERRAREILLDLARLSSVKRRRERPLGGDSGDNTSRP